MIFLMVALIVSNVLLVFIACWLAGRKEADFSPSKVTMVAAGIALLDVVLGFGMLSMENQLLGAVLKIGFMAALAAIAFHMVLYLQLRNAIIAAAIFLVGKIGLSIVISGLG